MDKQVTVLDCPQYMVFPGRPYCGLLAADTRVVRDDGTWFDDAEVDAGNPLSGPAITIGKAFRKFGLLTNGWCGMTGSATWGQLAVNALQQHGSGDIEALAHCVQENVTVPAVKSLERWPKFRLALVLRIAKGYAAYFMKPDGPNGDGHGCDLLSPTDGVFTKRQPDGSLWAPPHRPATVA